MGLETKANGLKDNSPTNENIDDTHTVQQNCKQSDIDERDQALELLQTIAQKLESQSNAQLKKLVNLLDFVLSSTL